MSTGRNSVSPKEPESSRFIQIFGSFPTHLPPAVTSLRGPQARGNDRSFRIFKMTTVRKSVIIESNPTERRILMKRLFCFLIALAMMLCACGAPVETTAPAETTLPATEPVVETALPTETVPQETAVPVETSAPDYTLRIEDPETMIYAGPSFVSGAVAMVGESGTYTIVAEEIDTDGNSWGKLKSGAGWIYLKYTKGV